jgi:hypothetical protein
MLLAVWPRVDQLRALFLGRPGSNARTLSMAVKSPACGQVHVPTGGQRKVPAYGKLEVLALAEASTGVAHRLETVVVHTNQRSNRRTPNEISEEEDPTLGPRTAFGGSRLNRMLKRQGLPDSLGNG